jgi:hypothetical protein
VSPKNAAHARTPPLPKPLRPDVVQPVKPRIVDATVRIHDAVLAHPSGRDLYPLGMSPEEVRDLLLAAIDVRGASQKAAQERSDLGRRLRPLEEEAERAEMRVLDLIEASYGIGERPGRGAFFHETPGEHGLVERLTAIVGGLKKQPLPGFATSGYTIARLEAILRDLPQLAAAHVSAADGRHGVSVQRAGILERVRELHKQWVLLLQGAFGRGNPALAQFGLKPRMKGARRASQAAIAARAAAKKAKQAEARTKRAERKVKKIARKPRIAEVRFAKAQARAQAAQAAAAAAEAKAAEAKASAKKPRR